MCLYKSWVTHYHYSGEAMTTESGIARVCTRKFEGLMKLFLPLFALFIAIPAHAGRDDFGMGAASVACAMLDSGISRHRVEKVLNLLERDIINSGISEREQLQMASGFNYQAARNNCSLRYRD